MKLGQAIDITVGEVEDTKTKKKKKIKDKPIEETMEEDKSEEKEEVEEEVNCGFTKLLKYLLLGLRTNNINPLDSNFSIYYT